MNAPEEEPSRAFYEIGPVKILKDAIRAVPAVKYALGIAGIVSAVAIAATLVTDLRVAVFGTLLMMVSMTILVVFAKLTSIASKEIKLAMLVLVWFSLLLMIASASLLFTSVFFKFPVDLQFWITGHASDVGSANLSDVIQSKKTIVLMDSPIRDVVYDFDTYQKGETNAYDIRGILKDIDVEILEEKTSLVWDKEERIHKLNPYLIIAHASCFYGKTNSSDSDKKFISFLRYMANTQTRFLIYGREPRQETWVNQQGNQILPRRIYFYLVKGGPAASFREVTTAREFKLKVKSILEITPPNSISPTPR